MAYAVAGGATLCPVGTRCELRRAPAPRRATLARARAAGSRVPARPASVAGARGAGRHQRVRAARSWGGASALRAIATPSGGDAGTSSDESDEKAKTKAGGAETGDPEVSGSYEEQLSAADAYAKMLRDRTETMRSNPTGEEAEAIKRRAAAYGSLDDIVLDFNPDLDVAEKLLLVGAYFQSAPAEVAARLAEVTAVATRLYATWTWEEKTGVIESKRTRGAVVRDGIASLGPVFVKMAQTLSTRPDIIGDEAADALKPLQDQMAPFSSVGAYEQIRDELRHNGPVHPGDTTWRGSRSAPPLYAELSDEPVAAASIGQVYKGRTVDGRAVAVKVQRPGVLRQIAMDLHIARITLIWIEESGLNGATDLANIVDRVGRGIFQELDYTLEASNADEFRRSLRFMDFLVVPRHLPAMTGRRVLTQEWIDGRPMKELTTEEQLKMVQWGVECSSAQLFRTGLVHADPHEGNMLYTDEGKLALLDFGLICRVNNEQQEAMAGCILNVLNRDWMDLIDNLTIIGMLPETPQKWVDLEGNDLPDGYAGGEGKWVDGDDESFRKAFLKCMDGDVSVDGDTKGSEKKLTNFTELVVDLTKLSTAWRFNLPPYMVFVIRSLTTLDFCAVRTGANMYELAAPTALFRAMAPKTPRGRAQLQKILMSDTGDVKWKELIELAESAGGASPGAGDDASLAPAASAAMDKHTKASVNRLVSELVGSSSGSALRRLLVRASPESLVPPTAVRDVIVKATRETFARSVAELTPGGIVRLALQAVRSFFAAIFSAKDSLKRASGKDETCDFLPEGSAEAYNCRVNIDRRRREIARLMVRSRLAAPKGALSAAALLVLFGWAAVTGAVLGVVRGIRLRLIKMLGGGGFEAGRGGTPKE
jgi:hypothetical protein